MKQSTVKWFDAKKGYGFITHPNDGEDIFVHYSDIESDDDFKTLQADQAVQFEMNDGPKGLNASNVVALDDGNAPETESAPAEGDENDVPEVNHEVDPAEIDPTAEVDPTPST